MLITLPSIALQPVKAASYTNSSVLLSDSRPSQAAVSYTIKMDNVTVSAIQCIKVAFSTSTSVQTKPTGMNIASATFSGTYIPTPASWTVVNTDASGVTTITGTAQTPAAATSRTIILSGITNGSTIETGYFVLVSTYNNTDCASSPVDNGTVMYIYNNSQLVTASVDPTLTFTIDGVGAGEYIPLYSPDITSTDGTVPFGTLTTATNRTGAHLLNISTNATNGFTVTTRYTQKLLAANGVDDINDHSGTNASPTVFPAAGTEAFGYYTNDYTLSGATPNRFQNTPSNPKYAAFSTNPEEVMYGATEGTETANVFYRVGIASATAAGFYQTTIIYTATAVY